MHFCIWSLTQNERRLGWFCRNNIQGKEFSVAINKHFQFVSLVVVWFVFPYFIVFDTTNTTNTTSGTYTQIP